MKPRRLARNLVRLLEALRAELPGCRPGLSPQPCSSPALEPYLPWGVAHDSQAPQPTPDEKCSEDAAFFREVLKEGRSLIVVRTESQELATSECAVLDRLGLGMQNRTPVKMQTSTRHIGDVAVLDITGRKIAQESASWSRLTRRFGIRVGNLGC